MPGIYRYIPPHQKLNPGDHHHAFPTTPCPFESCFLAAQQQYPEVRSPELLAAGGPRSEHSNKGTSEVRIVLGESLIILSNFHFPKRNYFKAQGFEVRSCRQPVVRGPEVTPPPDPVTELFFVHDEVLLNYLFLECYHDFEAKSHRTDALLAENIVAP